MPTRSRALIIALALLLPSGRARAAGEIVYVAAGDAAPPGARAGDSARIADRLAAAGRPVRRVDLTAAGMRVEELRQGSLARAVSLRPALVTVAIGAADACGTTELRRFARDLHTVTELLRRNAGVVVLSTMEPPAGACSRSGVALRRRVDAFNAVIARAAEQNGVRLARLRPALDGAASPWEAAVAAQLDDALAAKPLAADAGRGG